MAPWSAATATNQMIDAARLLGFAFANADFLFEVDGNGTIAFATGAARNRTARKHLFIQTRLAGCPVDCLGLTKRWSL